MLGSGIIVEDSPKRRIQIMVDGLPIFFKSSAVGIGTRIRIIEIVIVAANT